MRELTEDEKRQAVTEAIREILRGRHPDWHLISLSHGKRIAAMLGVDLSEIGKLAPLDKDSGSIEDENT